MPGGGSTPYVLVDDRKGGKGGKKGLLRMILSIYTMVLCGLLFLTGILSLVTTHTYPFEAPLEYKTELGVKFHKPAANFTIRVFSAYLLAIAFLFLCVELKSTTILTAFAGMISPLGRGVIYLINGFLVFGLVGNWGICIGLLWMICGILHIVLGARSCRTFYEEGTVDTVAVTTSTHTVTQTCLSPFFDAHPLCFFALSHALVFWWFCLLCRQQQQRARSTRPRKRTSAAAAGRRSTQAMRTAPIARPQSEAQPAAHAHAPFAHKHQQREARTAQLTSTSKAQRKGTSTKTNLSHPTASSSQKKK